MDTLKYGLDCTKIHTRVAFNDGIEPMLHTINNLEVVIGNRKWGFVGICDKSLDLFLVVESIVIGEVLRIGLLS